jgi:hypothetical protein
VKLVLHIVRKDLRRLRWPLAAWLALVAAKIGFGFMLIFSDAVNGDLRDRADDLVKGGMLLEGLLTFFLTAMLVQEDSLVGSSQFWLTRPIAGARLLGAKLAGFLLLLWLPAVVLMLPWWFTCGFGPGQMARAALELLVLQAVAAAPAAFVAAVTDTPSRFIAWAPVLLFGFGTISLVLSFEIKGLERTDDAMLHGIVGWSVLAVVAAGVIVRQFLRREVIGSLVWFGGGCVVAALVGMLLPVDWLYNRLSWGGRWTSWHAERAEGVTLVPHSFRSNGTNATGEAWLNTYLEVRGLSRDLMIGGGPLARQTWRWPGGPEVDRIAWAINARDGNDSLRHLLGVGEPHDDEETQRFYAQREEEHRRKNGYEPRVDPPRNHVELSTSVLPSTVSRLKRTPPAYEARVLLRLVRPVVLHTMPLQAGGWHAADGQGYRVGEPTMTVSRVPNPDWAPSRSLNARLVTTSPEFMWNEWLANFGIDDEGWGANVVAAFPAVNDLQTRYRWRHYTTATIGSVSVLIDGLWMGRPAVRRGAQWVLPDTTWADGAKLALIGYREEARFTRAVKAERFVAAATEATK